MMSIRKLTCSFIFLCFIPHALLAEIQFVHNAKEVKLGAAGTETRFSVVAVGPKRSDLPLDVEMIRDGKLSRITVPTAVFNHFDDPTYSFSVASPQAGLVYRFKVRDNDGKTWVSQYYWALQKCQEKNGGTSHSPQEPVSTDPTEKVLQLARRASVLETELLRTRLAEKRLTQLSKILVESPQ